jgi:predicted AAA+ superfamily ATPase
MVLDSSKSRPINGLPKSDELIINREETLSYLIKKFEKNDMILVSGPPFSGKSCLFELLKKKYKSKVIALSFAAVTPIKDENEAYEDLERHFQKKIGMSIEECLFNKEGKILITDETQRIYHVSKFWDLFKDSINSFCNLFVIIFHL